MQTEPPPPLCPHPTSPLHSHRPQGRQVITSCGMAGHWHFVSLLAGPIGSIRCKHCPMGHRSNTHHHHLCLSTEELRFLACGRFLASLSLAPEEGPTQSILRPRWVRPTQLDHDPRRVSSNLRNGNNQAGEEKPKSSARNV